MPLDELEGLLGRVDILEPLERAELRAVASGSRLVRLEAGRTMRLDAKQHEERAALLLDGRLRAYAEVSGGRTITVSVAEAGTLVGATGLVPRRRGLQLEAMAPSLLCLLAREAFEHTLLRNPEVGLRLSKVLAERIVVLEDRLGELAHKSVGARLAGALLRLAEGEGVATPEGWRIPTRYTHRQLATMIGANREATTRALKEIRELGLVVVEGRLITVTDPDGLRRMSGEG